MEQGQQQPQEPASVTSPRYGTERRGTGDSMRIVLIALGVVLLVAALPLLVMSGMMGLMMGGGATGMMGFLTLLVLATGMAALVAGIRHH